MNDAERDGWLREALRHAPDSDALPPSGVSEAILLKARAAARAAQPTTRRAAAQAAPANAFAAFWAWLARPPVAAGFASVMAATLVGLMWWDQPMDETMPRPPAMTSEHGDAAPPLASIAPQPSAATPEAPIDAAKTMPPARNELAKAPAQRESAAPPAQGKSTTTAAAADNEIRRRQLAAQEQAATRDAKIVAPAPATAAKAKAKADVELAKERALPAERKNEAPAPFPSTEAPRESLAARQAPDATAIDAAKKRFDAPRTRAADAVERTAAPPAAPSVAPVPTPAPALTQTPMGRSAPVGAATAPAPTAPLASGRLAADESRPAAVANNADADAPKNAAGGAPAATTGPQADRALRQRAAGDVREKDAAAFGAAAPAPFRSELERARPDASTRAAPLADLLAALGADPDRWSRQTAGGDRYPLDAGWRAWLGELDAAAAGRWRALGGVGASGDAAAARVGASALRLVEGGRLAATVRLEGDTVQVETPRGRGAERWQATLDPAAAERLRASAKRLPP